MGFKTIKTKITKIKSLLIPTEKGTKNLELVFFLVDEEKNRYQYISKGIDNGLADPNIEFLSLIEIGDPIVMSVNQEKIGVLNKFSYGKILDIEK
jgi:hypothetical protein